VCDYGGSQLWTGEENPFFIYLYSFGEADFEEKFLKIKYKKLIEERDFKKTEWGKTTSEFRGESFNLRYLLSMVIMQEKCRRV
jgi:hypothetical protein